MNKLILSSALVLSAFASNQALAGTANETFQANASVDRSCKIETTTINNGDFTLNAFSATDQNNRGLNTTIVEAKCTLHKTAAEGASNLITVRYSEGLHADAGSTCDAPLRRMKSANGDYISYSLTPSMALDKSFGCGTKYTPTLDAATNGFVEQSYQKLDYDLYTDPNVVNIYIRVAATSVAPGKNMSIGTYTDTITVTVEF